LSGQRRIARPSRPAKAMQPVAASEFLAFTDTIVYGQGQILYLFLGPPPFVDVYKTGQVS
jgi:hypothetical protein